MRIHSKFQDYYDSALAYGIDEQCHYVRHTQEHKEEATLREVASVFGDWKDLFGTKHIPTCGSRRDRRLQDSEALVLSFCGKRYTGVIIDVLINEKTYNRKKFVCWSVDDMNKVIKRYADKKLKEIWNDGTPLKIDNWDLKFGRRRDRYFFNQPWMQEVFATNGTEEKALLDMHHELEVPVVVCYDNKLELNPVLKDLEFYRIVDSFQAFQELGMFISGVLGGNSPKMIVLSDDMKIHKHGFDKFSFRKDKESK